MTVKTSHVLNHIITIVDMYIFIVYRLIVFTLLLPSASLSCVRLQLWDVLFYMVEVESACIAVYG